MVWRGSSAKNKASIKHDFLMYPDRKNYYWRIAGFYFFYYSFVGMFSPYWSLYLKSIQFSAIEIAILMSIQPVTRMIAPNIWGWLADHTGERLLDAIMR